MSNQPETKVTAALLVALLASVDPVLRGLLLAVIPPVAAFVGGYVAPHTPR